MAAHVTTEEVMRALRDVDFPASKQELIQAAQAAGASGEVIAALRALPPAEYRSGAEVERSIPVDPAKEEGLTPAQVAEAARLARRHRRQRGSQYSLEVPKPPVAEELDR
jgi:hypothetical protein